MNNQTQEISLLSPITVQGKQVDKLTLRMPTVGDEEDAMDMAITLGRSNNTMTLELCLFSKLANVPYDVLRNMDALNYNKIREAANMFLANNGQKKVETDLIQPVNN